MSNYFSNNLYERLGVDQGATKAEIKAAYRKLASEFHPDRNRDDGAHEIMQSIQEAYSVLSKPDRREHYDRSGEVDNPEARLDRCAETKIMEALSSLLMECDADPSRDYAEMIGSSLQRDISTAAESVERLSELGKKMQRILDNFDAGGDDNACVMLLRNRVDGVAKAVEAEEASIVVLKRSQEMMLGCEYRGAALAESRISAHDYGWPLGVDYASPWSGG